MTTLHHLHRHHGEDDGEPDPGAMPVEPDDGTPEPGRPTDPDGIPAPPAQPPR